MMIKSKSFTLSISSRNDTSKEMRKCREDHVTARKKLPLPALPTLFLLIYTEGAEFSSEAAAGGGKHIKAREGAGRRSG